MIKTTMANPRKFSEKIALHTHRQAEETARFEQIMKEVSDATSRVSSCGGGGETAVAAKNTLRINSGQSSLGAFRGGSLPNVSAKNAADVTDDDTKPEDGLPQQQQQNPHSPHQQQQQQHHHQQQQQHHQQQSSNKANYRESRARSQGGPIRRPQDRKHDTSPYSSSSGAFLSPPPDTSWRRTKSDSTLHQSAMQEMNNERNDNGNNGGRWMVPAMNGPEQHDGNRRPRSSCEVPRVPGINIYHTAHEPGTVQIPIGNNTGSLPDLTSVHFPSPIHAPLDQDQDQGSSPYSSSPVNTSPSTLSPTSLPTGVRQHRQFPFTTNQTHLSVPVNSRFLHHNKGVTVDKSGTTVENHDYTQFRGMAGIYHQQVPPTSPSPTLQQSVGYRSPRPSPQSSPSLGGRHSAPCSPGGGVPSPLSPLNTSDYHLYSQNQATQLQQHFEQFSMDWAQLVASLVESGCTWTAQVQMDTPVSSSSGVSYLDQQQQTGGVQQTQITLQEVQAELTGDAGYYSTSPSQLVYHTAPPSLHTTPNTPTSIPDIILTDFSVTDDITRQQFSKQLEAEFLADESLREGLEPLDFEGFQMLSDSGVNIIPDGVEDHFRLDRS